MQAAKRICLIFTFFICISKTSAQDFAPVGAIWHYTEKWAMSQGYIGYLKIEVTKDTIIQGKSCRELNCDELCYEPSGFQYVYSSFDSVFFYDKELDTFQLLYAFNADSTSSWKIAVLGESSEVDTVIIKVDSTTLKTINNQQLRLLYVTYTIKVYDNFGSVYSEWGYPGQILERIGDINYLFNIPNDPHIACDMNYSTGLRCYEDSVIGLYETGIAPSCTYTVVGINETSASPISIYPNPTTGEIQIENIPSNYTEIEIADITGRTVLAFNKNEKIHLRNLEEGIYFLKITDSENRLYAGKVIKAD